MTVAPLAKSPRPNLRLVEPRHNLPAALSSFVGRERELTEIQRRLSGTRLLTLTGPAGVGKTRLAHEAATGLLESFADGVWLVDLAALAAGDQVPQAVAAALGIRAQAGRPLLLTMADTLRHEQLLLILDNCEHLLEACAALMESLLRACPRLQILATSRQALRLAGETVLRVAPLSLPDDEALMESEAVRLFVARAQAAQQDFPITVGNLRAVASVCRWLDGIPLALELAAARVPGLGVEQLAMRLDDRLLVLLALPDWGYGLLSESEQVLLRRLAVFSGGWTLEAAEEVCAGNGLAQHDILPLLVQLVEKSQVLLEDDAGQVRYRLLRPLRHYSAEKLRQAGEEPRLQLRHRAWFAQPGPPAAIHRGLSAREREVALLVAQGYTNRAIAAALVVTERTAEGHVERIRGKLGFTSRAQVAAWAVQQQLAA